jgi:hypothetical protein
MDRGSGTQSWAIELPSRSSIAAQKYKAEGDCIVKPVEDALNVDPIPYYYTISVSKGRVDLIRRMIDKTAKRNRRRVKLDGEGGADRENESVQLESGSAPEPTTHPGTAVAILSRYRGQRG